MDDADIDRMIDNEKDWRRFLVTEMIELRKGQAKSNVEIGKIKVWLWVLRASVVAGWGVFYGWIRSQITHQ